MARRSVKTKIDFKAIALAGGGGVAGGMLKNALSNIELVQKTPVVADLLVVAIGAAVGSVKKDMEPLAYGMIGQGVSGALKSSGILNGTNRITMNGTNRIFNRGTRSAIAELPSKKEYANPVNAGMRRVRRRSL